MNNPRDWCKKVDNHKNCFIIKNNYFCPISIKLPIQKLVILTKIGKKLWRFSVVYFFLPQSLYMGTIYRFFFNEEFYFTLKHWNTGHENFTIQYPVYILNYWYQFWTQFFLREGEFETKIFIDIFYSYFITRYNYFFVIISRNITWRFEILARTHIYHKFLYFSLRNFWKNFKDQIRGS